ncbi:DUF397 domain-containing protein [Yinghuangia sp. YIM S10712]|uniref:DUF397 domain-containing protein n=1 Tax=Yinghuangia sp. YIM S10712 TaxID=3436930 RepID=UPI003F5392E0
MSNAQHDPVLRTESDADDVTADQPGLPWHRSTYSGGANNCVEAAGAPACIRVRDSKRLPGPVLAVASAAWCVFLGETRAEGPVG